MNDTAGLNQREDRVLDFISALDKEKRNAEQNAEYDASPAMKTRVLNDEYKNAPGVCIDTVLGKIYKDALPFDDPSKNMSLNQARDEMHQFIDKRCGGKGSEWYVREGIKKSNSSALKTLVNESRESARRFYQEKAKEVAKISIKDLTYDPTLDNTISTINKKMELDDITDIIHNNVQKALQDESMKAKNEEQYNKEIEDQLAADTDVQDQASLESAISKMNIVQRPTVYQPSLFEAILLGRAKIMQESAIETNLIAEAVHEYTKLNIIKALRLEKFDLASVKKLANSYL